MEGAKMPENVEIITDIRNKLQTSSLVIERMAEGKPVPENMINIAKSDLGEIEKLLSSLEGSKILQSKYERSL